MNTYDGQRRRERRLRFSLDFLETHEGTVRLEAFSDAVFAIAATLLVIDLKVPPGLTDSKSLWDGLLHLWPNYVSFVLSFIYLGVYWSHHFHLFSLFKRTDHIFFKINIMFLMMISFLPFPTSLLAEYLRTSEGTQYIAVLIYTGSLCVTAVFFLAIWIYATYRHRLIDQDLEDAVIWETTRHYLYAPIGYGFAFVAAFWNTNVSLAITVVVSLYYWLPFQVFRIK